ncbi:metalloregulator ArsR/SmtB family transcription factor [Actinoplanes subglobosus]|uniref:Metalloregulator ArsR/SmtB family transcription factor n=1 Tax=Actinoplanes subglobosus TaxID=1547892 RepID=A0ABV8IXA2_9ACTN
MGPPELFAAAGHPVRWRLLSELTGSDLAVHELTARLGQPQNLVSYHLGRLRRAGLVTARRSSADGRDTYYSLHLSRCSALLTDAGAALHPALRLRPPSSARPGRARVLFLCTGNSARSPMAEAILRRHSAATAEVRSAGINPKPLHRYAVRALTARGIDPPVTGPTHVSQLSGATFDHVITLCDRAKEACPAFDGPRRAHWSIPEPVERPDFDRLADQLTERIGFFLHTLAEES